MLLNDVSGSRVRSRARSRVGSHDHKFCNHGIIISVNLSQLLSNSSTANAKIKGLNVTLDNLTSFADRS